ncbi:MAG: hypothetical protein AB1644_13190 [Candidatus Zixiibacteriota bacterium]
MKRILLMTAAAVALVAMLVYAQPGPGAGMGAMCDGKGPGMGMRHDCNGCGMGRMGHMGRQGMGGGAGIGMILGMADKLELTDQQKAQLEKMHTDFQLQAIDARAAVQKANVRLKDLMRDDKTSEQEINAAIDQAAKMKADVAKMHAAHLRQAKGVLNEKQLGMLKDMRNDRRGRMMQRMMEDDDEDAPTPGPHGGRSEL